jgi:hypothetical protein
MEVPMLHWRLLLGFLALVLLLSACAPNPNSQFAGAQTAELPKAQDSDPTVTPAKSGAPGPLVSTGSAGDADISYDICPVTRPPDPPFTPPEPYPRSAPREDFWYGTDALWTALPQYGVWSALPHNPEGYTQKVVWWRKGYSWTEEPEPRLVVTGRRLDALAPPLNVSRTTNAYTPKFGSAMLVGVDFPTTGCWEVKGQYGKDVLSFVVWVGSVDVFRLYGDTPDPDAVKLMAMSEQARQIALQESADIVLRQVDTDLNTTYFQFVDRALSRVITVIVPDAGAPVDQWDTTVNSFSPLLGHAEPAIDLQNLRNGPRRVAEAIKAHWPGCTVRGIILYRENGQLTWQAFCKTSAGVVSGSLVDRVGIFQPSEAPPAPLPVTATPAN